MKNQPEPKAPRKTKKLNSLTAAAQAEAALEWEKAIGLLTQALDAKMPGMERYALLDRRAACYRRIGLVDPEIADIEAMLALAQQDGSLSMQVKALTALEWALTQRGQMEEARQRAEQALSLAQRSGDRKLEADSLSALCDVHLRQGRLAEALQIGEQAITFFRSMEDAAGEANVLGLTCYSRIVQGHADDARPDAERALELFRQTGDLEGQGNALNILSMAISDPAGKRDCLEQSLALFRAAGNRERCSVIENNLASQYSLLGLYERARQMFQEALDFARLSRQALSEAYYLGNLGGVILLLGRTAEAIPMLHEALQLAERVGDRPLLAGSQVTLSQAFLQQGQPDQAARWCRKAAQTSRALESPDQINAMAWLGAAQLAQGEPEAALRTVRRITSLRRKFTASLMTTANTPPQEAWWWQYRILAEAQQAEAAWQALDQARQAMLDGVASLSDDGLRRNYFNKVAINRDIIKAWLEEADRRKLPLAALTGHLSGAGNVQDPFKRLIDIGVRLNALRDPAKLPDSILSEVVELNGAERAALFLAEAHPAAIHLPAGESQADFVKKIQPVLKEVASSGQPVLRYAPEKAAALKQRSILSVPLIAAGRQVGVIYTELDGSFGRFTHQDLDLLTVLANQSAVALENARWTQGLEQKVAERTEALNAARGRTRHPQHGRRSHGQDAGCQDGHPHRRR